MHSTWFALVLAGFALVMGCMGGSQPKIEPGSKEPRVREGRSGLGERGSPSGTDRRTSDARGERGPQTPQDKIDRADEPARRGLLELGADRLGEPRSAYYHVPAHLDLNTPNPVIFVFHGGKGSSARDLMDDWRSQLHGDAILVFPNGQLRNKSQGAWFTESGDDPLHVDVVLALRESVIATFNADPKRMYAAGHSSGAHMTMQLMCRAPEGFAGFATVNHHMKRHIWEHCRSGPVRPLLHIASRADAQALWQGKTGPDGALFLYSAEQTRDLFISRQGCASSGAQAIIRNPMSVDQTRVKHYRYDGCKAPYEFLEIEGGGHAWPGGAPKPGVKTHCKDIDGASEAVDFFGRRAGL